MRSLIFEIFPGPQAALVAAACRVMLERGLGPAEVLAQYDEYIRLQATALSDGPNAVPLKHMRALLETLMALDAVTKKNGFLENSFSA